MKCINKAIALIIPAAVLLSGCGNEIVTDYDIYSTSYQYGLLADSSDETADFFAEDLCVTDENNIESSPSEYVAEAAAVFNGATKEIKYAKNLHERMYPASTTKIMTAYCALKYGNLDQKITVSNYAVKQSSDSSTADLKAGDVLTLRQLLYGMMLPSGNDAAIAIAEGISGSVEEFVSLMNSEAAKLGATNTHFVNPNGLHDEDHYTTVYDMYLMFNEAVKDDTFLEIIGTEEYAAYYTSASGSTVEQTWKTSNLFVVQETATAKPEGVTVVGGKTGTTNPAGYCLVLLSRNESDEPIISIVYKADCRLNVYFFQREIIKNFAN